jgi:mRNA-degrading endonuclease RelE of RelBE toxin-antitoxin system
MEIPACSGEKIFCDNCNNHFSNLRGNVTEVTMTKHFEKDLKDSSKRSALVSQILDCSSKDFHELHKFEFKAGESYIFRAKKDSMHVLYGISGNVLVFLRAIRNYGEYRRFLTEVKGLF